MPEETEKKLIPAWTIMFNKKALEEAVHNMGLDGVAHTIEADIYKGIGLTMLSDKESNELSTLFGSGEL
jgi:hypothetical protein